MIDNKAEKYYPITTYAYAANNPIRFIDSDGNKIVDATGNVIYTQQGGWSKNAPTDAVRLGKAMMGTRTGILQFNKMVNTDYGITLNISQEKKVYKIGGKTVYKLGEASKSVSYNPNTGDYKINSVDVTVFEGTLNEYLEKAGTSKSDAYRESTKNNDQAIGAIGAHESVHATDKQNIEDTMENKVKGTNHDTENEPVKVEMQVLDEQHIQNLKTIDPITTIKF